MAYLGLVGRKARGSYVEAVKSVDKRSDAGHTFSSRYTSKRGGGMLATLLEIREFLN